MDRIYYTKPSITDKEIEYAALATRVGWGPRCYEYLHEFEKRFREHIGTRYAIATSSCTGALHLGLSALGIRSWDEVILADTNWIATVAPIVHLGAKPVFVDTLPATWCIDPAAVTRAITPRTKAIIATHLYGNLCAMDCLRVIGEEHNIPIIEDAAEAIGSIYHGRMAGSMGRFGVFSFHGSKTITTGEGGMFVTSDPDLYEKVFTLAEHGRRKGQTKQFFPDEIGFKYKMSNVQAAIGCAQMERINELVQRKRDILHYYMKRFAHLAEVSMNEESPWAITGAWMPNIVFSPDTGIRRDVLFEKFTKANIDARVMFHPLSSLPMFVQCPNNFWAYDIPPRAINLPSYHDLTDAEQDRVIAVIRDLMEGK